MHYILWTNRTIFCLEKTVYEQEKVYLTGKIRLPQFFSL